MNETREVEVFRAGSYPQGEFSQADVEAIAAGYDPAVHEAPVTLDHESSGPAHGWVESLRSEGGRLFARLRGLSERLRELIANGRYKKVSVEIYPDFEGAPGRRYLRAVSFLGAGVPQVKGLAPVALFDEKGPYVRPDITARRFLGTLARRLKGMLRLIESPSLSMPFGEKVDAHPKQSAPQQTTGARPSALDAERAALMRERRLANARNFCEALVAEGRLLPASVTPVARFIEFLDGTEEAPVIRFSEEGETPARWFMRFLATQPAVIPFGEAAPEKARSANSPEDALHALTLERMRMEPRLTYGEAFRLVTAEKPGLAASYLEQTTR